MRKKRLPKNQLFDIIIKIMASTPTDAIIKNYHEKAVS
jgi:hypothetical protein